MQNETYSLNQSDLKKYSALEVANLVDVDAHAIRDEGVRRQDAAEKKIEKLKKQLEQAQKELNDSHIILNAFYSELKEVVPSVKITNSTEVPNRLKVVDGRLTDQLTGADPIFGPEWNGIESVLLPSAHLKSFIDRTKESNSSPEFEGIKIEAYNWMNTSDGLFVALSELVRKRANGESPLERDAIDNYFDAANQTSLQRKIRKPH